MNNENKKGRPKQTQDNTFQERFLNLVGETSSHTEIAEKIGTSRQNVGNWLNGKSNTKPDIYTLAKIAKAYGVSTDYLLGLNDEKSANLDVQAMHRYTGLYEKSIDLLHTMSKSKSAFCSMIDLMIQTGTLTDIANDMGLLALYSQLPKEKIEKSIPKTFNVNNIYDFDNDDLCSMYRYRAIENLISLLDKVDMRNK